MPKLVSYFFSGGEIAMTKPYNTYEEQLAILESLGLGVKDRERALHALQHHSYYRLSAYRFPLQVSEDQFRSSCTFEELLGHVFSLIEPENNWKERLMQHLKALPSEFMPAMGFPSDWAERPAWKRQI